MKSCDFPAMCPGIHWLGSLSLTWFSRVHVRPEAPRPSPGQQTLTESSFATVFSISSTAHVRGLREPPKGSSGQFLIPELCLPRLRSGDIPPGRVPTPRLSSPFREKCFISGPGRPFSCPVLLAILPPARASLISSGFVAVTPLILRILNMFV